MTDLLRPRDKEPEQLEIEKYAAEVESLKKKRDGFAAEQVRIKQNLGTMDSISGKKELKEQLREKYTYELKQLEAKTEAISKLIESHEGHIAKMRDHLQRKQSS